jgi:hypothetical protein
MRGYYLSIEDDSDVGDFVVASNIKQAKQMFMRNGWLQDYDDWFLRMRVKWARKANVDGLSLGTTIEDLETKDIFDRNICSYMEYAKCPLCGQEDVSVSQLTDGTVCCYDCEEEK